MIDLYTFGTPNGRKISIMLEETGLPYRVHPIHLGRREQFAPDFLKISPNNKIPAIVDQDGPDGEPVSVFESGAILIYLAEKAGRLLPSAPRARIETLEWLMWQMAGMGPMFGQLNHFKKAASETIPYAIARYTEEAGRLLSVLDRRLDGRDHIAGDYGIADIACYPWALSGRNYAGLDYGPYPNVMRWMDRVGARPAVRAGMKVP